MPGLKEIGDAPNSWFIEVVKTVIKLVNLLDPPIIGIKIVVSNDFPHKLNIQINVLF